MAVLFIGVAASSSFQHITQLPLFSPGQSTRVGAYTIHYVRPTAALTPHDDPTHTGSTLNVGAVLRVTKDGHYVATLRPSEDFYESQEESQGSVGHLIGGQPVSNVGINASLTRDIWSAIAPELETRKLKHIIEVGNKTIPFSRPDEGLFVIDFLAHEYLKHPPPAQFRLIVSPLIMWIWLGGLIVFAGGLLALSPSPGALRRRLVRPASLELAREVKYRELRDLELDLATGKLSREDYEATNATLRAEALEILDQLEPEPELQPEPPTEAADPTSPRGQEPLPGLLQQDDGVSDEQDREEDSPAVEVALHE
jgi:hypothetical protein